MRRWTSFDTATTNSEFRTIPQPDRKLLFFAMDRFAKDKGIAYVAKDYGGGLFMIKDNGGHGGRCLFFTYDEADRTLLVALLAYKKESDEAPKHLLEAARKRRGRYIESRRESR